MTTPDGLPLGSWVTYETVVRAMFFEFFRENPRYVLENFLIVKPWHYLLTLGEFLRTVWHDLSPARIGMFFLMLCLVVAFVPHSCRSWRALVAPSVALLLVALIVASIPSLVTYANTWVIADQAYILLTLVVLSIIGLATALTAVPKSGEFGGSNRPSPALKSG